METQPPKILSKKTIAASKFLQLDALEWQDRHGNARRWDCASRTGGHGQAAYLVPRLMPERKVVLVRQFRPPAGSYCLEFPAGLVEPGEDPAQAALRELAEETGYTGTVVAKIPQGYSSAGLTDETSVGFVVEIDSEYYRQHPPTPHPEATEDIEVLAVPEAQLRTFLQERLAAGDSADAKLLIYAATVAASHC